MLFVMWCLASKYVHDPFICYHFERLSNQNWPNYKNIQPLLRHKKRTQSKFFCPNRFILKFYESKHENSGKCYIFPKIQRQDFFTLWHKFSFRGLKRTLRTKNTIIFKTLYKKIHEMRLNFKIKYSLQLGRRIIILIN
jgi:hypothetical protein